MCDMRDIFNEVLVIIFLEGGFGVVHDDGEYFEE